MLIFVTKEHINEGQQASGYSCPVALAISEATKRPVIVADGCVEFGDTEQSYRLPKFVTNWYRRFDCEKPVRPIAFKLDLQSKSA